MKVNPRTIVDEILAELKERSFAGIYCAMHERYARSAGNKPRWGEKTPHNLFFVKEILQDFPNAQFIFITRDGRDASADYIDSAFGPTNIFCAAESWALCQNAVRPWRKKLATDQWMDLCYEDLVKDPVGVLKDEYALLGEKFAPEMLEFHKTELARNRGATKDHKPLGHEASDRYIGIYKRQLSQRDQEIFAAVAGKELEEAGYKLDVRPATVTEEQAALWRELDGRTRAATMDAPEGHIVYELQRLAGRPARGAQAPRPLDRAGRAEEPVPDRAPPRGDDHGAARLALLEGVSVREAPLCRQVGALGFTFPAVEVYVPK
jgi:hypothetical protein